jgi:hypothetical protein
MTFVDRSVMRELGDLIRERIVRRTLAGQDASGAAFAGYSDGYAKKKSEALGTTRVDLSVSGEMLNAMQVVNVTDRTVTLGFRR